jgi:hypothetical protein
MAPRLPDFFWARGALPPLAPLLACSALLTDFLALLRSLASFRAARAAARTSGFWLRFLRICSWRPEWLC